MSVESRLPKIANAIPDIVLDAARRGADQIAADARDRAPVDSGDLRDSIHVERVNDGYSVVAGNTRVWYGHLVEHGTVKSAAHPFLIPAFESNIGPIVTDARRHLKDV